MPISRDSFEKGRVDLAAGVLAFLRFHRDQAFTLVELHEGLKDGGVETELLELRSAVAELVKRGVVQKREIGDEEYFIYAVSLGFRT